MTVTTDIQFAVPGTAPLSTFEAFRALTLSLQALVEAERDVMETPMGDTAFDHWLTDAEAARAHFANLAHQLAATATPGFSASLMRGIAIDCATLLEAQDDETYRHAVKALSNRQHAVSGGTAMQMPIKAFLKTLAQLLQLPDYRPESAAPFSLAA